MSAVVAPCRSLSPAAAARTAPTRAWSAERYLAALHPADSRGKVSFLARQGDRVSAHTCAQDMMAAAAGPLLEQTAYVCMNRFYGPRGGGRRLAALNAVWLDLDVYRAPALDGLSRPSIAAEILRRARSAGLPPLSFLVDSGRGFYAIWLLAGAAPAAEPRWRAALRALVDWARDLGADPACVDPARVLRLPESWHDGVGRQVAVLAGDGARHGFDALCDAIWRAAGRPDRKQLDERRQRKPVASAARTSRAGGLPRVARWRAVSRDLDRLRAHWGGAIPEGRRGLWLHLHACALAWIDPSADIPDAIAALAADATPGLAPREARRCAGTVARRAAQAARGRRSACGLDLRYDYGGGRMADLLDVDADLAQRLGLEQVISAALRVGRRARARQAGRRAAGVLPRAIWLAANPLSRERPWRAEGVSRATWYRRRAALRSGRLRAALAGLRASAATLTDATLTGARETGAVPLYGGVAPPGATAPRCFGFNSFKLHQTPTKPTIPTENRPAEQSNLTPRAGSTPSTPSSIPEPAPDHAEETVMPEPLIDAKLLAAAADTLAAEDVVRLLRIAGILALGGAIAVRDIAARVGVGVGAGGGVPARLMPWLRLSADRLSVVGLAMPPARQVQGTLFDLAPVPAALTAAPAVAAAPRKPTIRGAVIAAGVTALTDAGVTEASARSFLGEMLKLYRLGPVAEAVDAAYARQGQIAEPRSWIRVNGGVKTGHVAAQKQASGWAPSAVARALAR